MLPLLADVVDDVFAAGVAVLPELAVELLLELLPHAAAPIAATAQAPNRAPLLLKCDVIASPLVSPGARPKVVQSQWCDN